MSVETACQCPDGFGLPHTHVTDYVMSDDHGHRVLTSRDIGWVRLWVDWKAVARA